jgi:uncharacterized membrane protein YbhN (UPF0104 family)
VSQPRTPAEGVSIDPRKAVLALLLAVLLAGAAFAVVGQAADFHRLSGVIARARQGWLPICVLGQLVAYAGYVLAYRAAARASGGPRFSWSATACIVIFGTGASVLGASVGGLAVDYWALRRAGTLGAVATRRVLAIGTTEWTVLSVYACAAAGVGLLAGSSIPLGMALGWLIAVPTCVGAALWLSAPGRVERFIEPPRRPAGSGGSRVARAAGSVRDRSTRALGNALAGVLFVRHLVSHPLRYHDGAIGYPIYWAGDMLTLYAALRSFGIHPSLAPMILAYATSFVISALPLPAGGAGGVEAAMALALHAIGISLAPALLAVFLYRVITFWLPLVPALLLLPRLRGLRERLPSVPHTERDPDEPAAFRRGAAAQDA